MEVFAAAVEASALGGFMRGSAWAYPAANLVHLLGLVLLVGAIGIVDLRVIGAFWQLPLAALSRALTPLAVLGLAALLVSGPLLFAADAGALIGSDMFLRKLVLVGIAIANALAFRAMWSPAETGEARAVPGLALRLMAAASILLWLTVAALGRLIAYV